jgi:serine/threonine protein kinase
MFVGDAFCSSCGTPLGERTEESGAERREHATRTIATGNRQRCASCHSPILPDDVFCATCGARHGVVEVQGPSGYDAHIPSQLVEANRGKYEILRELGRGGMGYVYLARDLELDRLDAIKVLKPSMLAEEGMVERFRAEARTIAKLRHQSIVTVYGVGSAGNLYYFVMDYIEGTSLSRVLRQQGPLSIQAVQTILYQVGSALNYAHASIIHRDVKPANVMLTPLGRAVVTDFGIAKVTEGQAGLTRTGVLMGTPEYMSPEQCREATVTHHSDQYALGAVAFAMLTGAPPFTGQWLQVAAAHQTKPVPRIQEFRPDCPDDLAQAVERMLAKYPTERWPTINDALRHLKLRPLASDDPALMEIAGLVRSATAADEAQKRSQAGATPASSRTPTDLRIVAPTDDIELGDVVRLQASMHFDDGIERNGEGLKWESTDPSIARVDSDSGELRAVGVGSVQITARAHDVSGSLALGVQPQRVIELLIQPRNVEIECGQAVQLLAEPRNKRGERMDRPVTWSSSDPRSIRVSAAGLVTAYKPGSASVLANCEGAGSAAMVTVHPGPDGPITPPPTPATGQRMPASAATVAFGAPSTTGRRASGTEERQQPATIAERRARPRDGEGTPSDRRPAAARVAPRAPAWRRPLVVVPAILVVAAASSIPFLMSPGPSTAAGLRVTHAQTGESVGDDLELPFGGSLRLVATATDENGNALDRPVVWRSADESVATIDGDGVLVAAAGGTTSVTATVDSFTRPIAVTVSVSVTSVSILGEDGRSVEELSVDVGETAVLEARVVGEDGNVLDPPVAWRSVDEEIVGVANGRLIAFSAGRTSVEAAAGGVSGTVTVIVREEAGPGPIRTPVPVTVDIIVTGAPFATLYLNDILVGEEQRTYRVTLSPGTNRIRLLHPAFPPHDRTINSQNLVAQPGQERPQIVIQMTR